MGVVLGMTSKTLEENLTDLEVLREEYRNLKVKISITLKNMGSDWQAQIEVLKDLNAKRDLVELHERALGRVIDVQRQAQWKGEV